MWRKVGANSSDRWEASLRRGVFAICGAAALLLAMTSPAFAVSKNVERVKTLPGGKWATAINFLNYGGKDVMMVTGRFGLQSYSLADPANPQLLDQITSQDLELPGDPPTDFTVNEPGGDPVSTFWQNEDMDVDQARKLVLISRDPRSYRGSTSREPGNADANGATNIAGVYIVDAKNPADLKLTAFQQLPTGHTTTCINDCQWLWTGGPAATTAQQQPPLNWAGGRPLIVTDLRDPAHPVAHPMEPVDLFRRDGVTAYSHDVQVDDMGIAWVSGEGGTRGYWTQGTHRDPLTGQTRAATPLNPIPYGGGGFAKSETNDDTGGFEHNAERPVGPNAPRAYRNGEYLLATEEDFADPDLGCSKQGHFNIASLEGSYDGEAWRSTAKHKFRLKTVGSWAPYKQEGSRPIGGPYAPGADFCSAHYFDVRGTTVAYAWYGEGTRFLDISDPKHPKQIAYWRPDDTLVWASYFRGDYIYTADHVRGIDVLRLTSGANLARTARREVRATPMSAKQQRLLARLATTYRADPATRGLCLLIQ
jgi:hypothetical protein